MQLATLNLCMQAVLQQLLGSQRLCLVLDLDHTLVNSAKFAEVDADWEFKLEQLAADQVTTGRRARFKQINSLQSAAILMVGVYQPACFANQEVCSASLLLGAQLIMTLIDATGSRLLSYCLCCSVVSPQGAA